ncbi:MAG TPA: exodeoxyribonuclease VII large subunit [Candidatus Polarisedimenticolia bacterium]|jgi:exodeoxyribonuclease VII large subunit|nr:exodeoxyribonuclease VII large subunit [Candidatus Polarisedimenticolia bacterium]
MRNLFDPPDKPGPGSGAAAGRPREERRILTVSELNLLTQEMLEDAFSCVWVEGEISNLRRYPSGHTYFTLKDADAQVAAVLFRGASQSLPFRPEDGLKILARGTISLYVPRGTFQIIVDAMEPAGLGALQLAFEQLKARLLEEGLFDASRKRPLPVLPRRIGIVSSPAGAALRDILKVLSRRFANVEVVIAPSRVQGDGASAEIVEAIRSLNRLGGIDVIILARGGGSLEDLWPFNEERVARAIAASEIPVISGIGHEVDVTIADLVADLRAPTPSAAAEMVVRSKQDLLERIGALRSRLLSAARLLVARGRQDLDATGAARAGRAVADLLRDRTLELDDLTERLRAGLERRTTGARHRLALLGERMTPARLAERLLRRSAASQGLARLLRTSIAARMQRARNQASGYAERLQALSPLAVLSRGYTVCRLEPDGTILKDSAAVRTGDAVRVLLHRGSLGCAVTEVSAHGEVQVKR